MTPVSATALSRRRGLPLAFVVSLLVASSAFGAVSTPVEKWRNGGCFSSWCQTGWYSSLAVADLDGNGQPEVIWGAYDLVVLRGTDGALRARASNGGRVWPGVAVADLTGDGSLEIVVGRGSDQLTVYRTQVSGPTMSLSVLWQRNPFGSGEVRSLAVEDLETDGLLDIVVGRASGGSTKQLNAFDAAGNARAGWPARRDGEVGYGWGMYNENVAVGDLDADGLKEVVGPTDTHYITALDRNGNQLPASSIYDGSSPSGPKVWSQVGVHVDHAVDLRGYANCGVEHRPNFADSAPVIADVDANGVPEIVVVGNVYNCGTSPYTSLYQMPFILNLDRTRWSGSGFDWTAIPAPGPGSGPLSEDYNVIETALPNPVVADLDGDGLSEILYPSYDGKLHAYWLDKTEHGSWPYDVPGSGIRFASEPVVADLDGDGQAEVLFTSWTQKSGSASGSLHVLGSLGQTLHIVTLPPSFPAGSWNGGLAAPTLADIDGDANLEVVVGTAHSGVVAYDLPGTAGARVLWRTGRGSFQRAGTTGASALSVNDVSVAEGDGGSTDAVFTVTLSPPASVTVTVDWTTADSTATAGSDYTVASGSLSFPPGTTSRTLAVPVLGDLLDEPDETFLVNFSSPTNATLADPQGQATILDDDPTPLLSVADTSVTEGDSGSTDASFTVSLSSPSAATVSAAYTTADNTALAGSDYTASSGSVAFPPGSTVSQTVTVPVLGDTLDEPDERFWLLLSSPANALLTDDLAQGTILDDDGGGFALLELAHGSTLTADLRVQPGPSPDLDLYVLEMKPRTSWEVLLDQASGDLGSGSGPRLERLAPDLVTTLDSSLAAGVGPARSLRLRNTSSLPQDAYLAVSSNSCTTDCTPEDTYRLRARETTASIPRFNNAGSQTTVLVLQNTTAQTVSGDAHFWSGSGALLASWPFSLAPRATLVLPTASLPALQVQSGSVTLAHDGPYAALVGKTVALEPATGFSFDSPLVDKPR